jgi:TP901 family phage tail tape measure protein
MADEIVSTQLAVTGLDVFQSAFKSADKLLDGFVSKVNEAGSVAVKGFEKIGSSAVDAAEKLVKITAAATAVGVGVASAFGKVSLDAFGNFEQSMNGIAAVSDLTQQQMDALTKSALDLGAKFPVSAKDAADGFGELAKAGFSANEILASGTGLVTLAVAGQLSMARSSDILTGAIRGFGLAASDAQHVVDLLAVTANASSVDVSDLGESFKYVAPIARAAGFSIEDMSVALGLMGNAMIKGSDAGTALRAIITRMEAPPKDAAAAMKALGISMTDANGKAKPFSELMDELRSKFAGLSEQQQVQLAKQLAGADAMSGLLAIVRASPADYDAMTKAIKNADGQGEKMMKTMSGGLKGAIENMKGSIETLQIKIGKLLAPASYCKAANAIADLANKAGELVDKFSLKRANPVGKLLSELLVRWE